MDSSSLVWHYTDATGLLSIVRSHTLWATSSAFLNDDQEILLGARRLRETVERRMVDDDLAQFVLQRLDAGSDTRPSPGLSPFFILSAAQEPDLLAMWRCYGGRGESYAVGLDPTAPLPVLADAGIAGEHLDLAPESAPWSSDPWAGRMRSVRHRPWTPVAYEDADQEELAARVLRNLPEAMETVRGWGGSPPRERAEIPAPLLDLMEDFEQALVLIKHGGFRDEREVRRIVSVLNRPDLGEEWPGVVRHRASAYGIAPYVALTGGTSHDQVITEEAHPLPIRAVAISPSPNGPAAAEALGSMLRSAGYDVPVQRSAIPFRGTAPAATHHPPGTRSPRTGQPRPTSPR